MMKVKICGTIMKDGDTRIGGPRTVCTKAAGHDGEHGHWTRMLQVEHAEAMTTGIEVNDDDGWIDISDRLPEPNQWITAEIMYMGKISVVHGKRSPNEVNVVFFDFWSGTGADLIVRWKPRTPSFEQGHPYTAIERGEPPVL
jgi:hypothetical protein